LCDTMIRLVRFKDAPIEPVRAQSLVVVALLDGTFYLLLRERYTMDPCYARTIPRWRGAGVILLLLVHLLEVLCDPLAHLLLIIDNLFLTPNEDLDYGVTMLDAKHPFRHCIELLHVMGVIVPLQLVEHLLVVEGTSYLEIP